MHPKLKIKILNYSFLSFHFFGVIGYTLGLILGLFLTYSTGLAIWPSLICAITGVGVLIGLTFLYKKITGKEDLVYYEHELSILAFSLLFLWLLNQPILKYLDITIVSIGLFLVFGRIGCFSMGCCHGRPHKKGVLYSKAHVEEGFPSYYQGVRIFPIQLVESASAIIIVVIGVYLILKGSTPGTVLLVYSIIYGLVRFVLEFFRGDIERPYWLNFSEAQWTTLGIFLLSIVLTYYNLLPDYLWHSWIVGGLVLFMLCTTIFRYWQKTPLHKILHPKHISEIAKGIEVLHTYIPSLGEILIVNTSLGFKISKGTMKANEKTVVHYTISKEKNLSKKRKINLNQNAIKTIGRLLRILKHPTEEMEIIIGASHVFHIIFSKTQVKAGYKNLKNSSIALELRKNKLLRRVTHW